MYRSNTDFVFTVTRDFVRNCRTPILVLPDVPAHPNAVALESAHLAPNAQVSIYPCKANPEQIQLALRYVRAFLKAHRPTLPLRKPWRQPRSRAVAEDGAAGTSLPLVAPARVGRDRRIKFLMLPDSAFQEQREKGGRGRISNECGHRRDPAASKLSHEAKGM